MHNKIIFSFQLLLFTGIRQVCFSQTFQDQQTAMNTKLVSITNGLKNTTFNTDSLNKYDYKTSGAKATNMLVGGNWSSLLKPAPDKYDKVSHFDRLQNIAILYRSYTITNTQLKAEMIVTLKKGIQFLDAHCCIGCDYGNSSPGYSTYCDYPNRYANILLTLKNDVNFPGKREKYTSQQYSCRQD